ncbi:hypothetical protein JN11_04162 [Mucilaginibacter frigoritolerans]|uniref:Uncharacterized protein n=1 Tax=Mucilaginibacter frigoritolerans TaxID=652788 RepID=A0A562TQM8_9SPHI|nr:hypothetical protein JN11_04162 [Mucilaginibacter frigoritolerans]
MKYINKKYKKSALGEYKTTLILLSILVAIMTLVIFMPLKREKNTNHVISSFSR